MIGLLHPGEMGAAVGQCLTAAGHQVLWAPEGRSAGQRGAGRGGRADRRGGGLAELAARADVIVSVCPPHAALGRRRVQVAGFGGVYVDANAISPGTAREVAQDRRGGRGQLRGRRDHRAAPVAPGITRLYLSGARGRGGPRLFAGTAVDARVHRRRGAARRRR